MGLDGVELVMEFEEAFDIELKDEEVTETKTPRMVIDLIFSKLKNAEERICRSQRAFYIIRNTLLERLRLDRKAIRPASRLRDLIPQSQEEQIWEEIRQAVSPRDWPELVRPVWMSRLLLVVGFAIFITVVLVGIPRSLQVKAGPKDGMILVVFCFLGGIALSLAFGFVGAILTRPFQIHISPCFISIRDLIPYAITSDRMPGWTREDVAAVVKRLTMEQLGLDEASYTEDSRFVEDFNID
jgi:acyl carrier protein